MIAAHEFVSPEPVTVSPVWLPVAREYHVFPLNAEVAKSWLCFFVKAGPVYVPPTVPSAVPRCTNSRMMMSPASVAGRVMLNDVVVVVPPSAFAMKVTATLGLREEDDYALGEPDRGHEVQRAVRRAGLLVGDQARGQDEPTRGAHVH